MTDTAPQPFASSPQNEGDTNEPTRCFLVAAIKRSELERVKQMIEKK